MKFALRKPCPHCPFRTDIAGYLTRTRAAEIATGLLDQQQPFSCHEFNEFDEDGDTIEGHRAQHCAGALIFLEAQERPNQLMRIAERLGFYDHTQLDMDAPVHRTRQAFIKHHTERRCRSRRPSAK
jgi:hypothetical protein